MIADKAIVLSEQSRKRLTSLISLFCVFLFIYTSFSKIRDHKMFFDGLSVVEVIGKYAFYISWFVPVSEIAISVLLIFPQTNKLGLYAFVVLMSIFTFYIISMLLWAKRLACSCGGVVEHMSWGQHVWFNIAFIALASIALRLNRSSNNKN